MSENQKMQYQNGKNFIFGAVKEEIVGMHKSLRKTYVFLGQIHSLKNGVFSYKIVPYLYYILWVNIEKMPIVKRKLLLC